MKLFDFFLGEYSSIWPNLSRFLPNLVKILMWNFSKKLFWKKFLKFCEKPRVSSTKIYVISPYSLQFYSGFILRWKILKKFTQVLSYVLFTQLGRHVHKQIKKQGIGKKIQDAFFFEKPVLFTLGLGLITPYSLGLFVWDIYHTFFIVCANFWLSFDPQIRPTRFAINFLFNTVKGERKVRLCVKLFDFFLGEYSSVWPEICHILFLI